MGESLDAPGPVALALAREAVERYVRTGLVAGPPPDMPEALGRSSGVFVTLRARGRLRGCVGTLALQGFGELGIMLSRVAEACFWMGRYVERAENVARILDVNHQGVAYGRDYADVTPIKGSYRGSGVSSLDVDVTVGAGRQAQQ